ncbi:MAG: T9SS type A sorting domain-containing protein [Bacteroidetes bacterium]|jgi:hypothetical protein|nr:T9SS type A sorting domain-containing protein [Bacteroidota bacterium]
MKLKQFLILVIVLGNTYISHAQFAGGKGTGESPWLISTVEHLDSVRYFLSDTFLLTNDIDLKGSLFDSVNSSAGWKPISANFKGYFNGCGHTIYNLYINKPGSDDVGLFSSIWRGCIDSLFIKNCYVEGSSNVGGLAGSLYFGEIRNCGVDGTVKGVYESIGGLVGYVKGSTVRHSFSKGNVLTGDKYNKHIGGLLGLAWETKISECFSYCNVRGDDWVGGIVGTMLKSSLRLCYSTGKIIGNDMVGGISGDGTIIQCYSTSYVVGISGPVGGIVGYGNAYNSYFTGKVKAYDVPGFMVNTIGGVVGLNIDRTNNCYNVGTVIYSGDTRGGFIVGGNDDGWVTNSYFNKDIARVPSSSIALSSSDMRKPTKLTNLFESESWAIRVDSTYPALVNILNNAPFSFNDTIIVTNSSIAVSRIIENDYDYETIQESLVYRIDEIFGSVTIENDFFIIPPDAGDNYLDSLSYTIGELTADNDTLWGNQSKVYLYKAGNITASNELQSDLGIFVYPNPTIESIVINSSIPINFIRLIDTSGKILITQASVVDSNISIDVSSINSGIYMLQIFTDNGKMQNSRIVKK